MDTYCIKCGQRYRLGTDHVCPKTERAAKKLETSSTVERQAVNSDVGGSNPPSPAKPKFDKVAYQRNYMRERRQRLKQQEGEPK